MPAAAATHMRALFGLRRQVPGSESGWWTMDSALLRTATRSRARSDQRWPPPPPQCREERAEGREQRAESRARAWILRFLSSFSALLPNAHQVVDHVVTWNGVSSRRREFCHFEDTPFFSLLKRLLQVEGGAVK